MTERTVKVGVMTFVQEGGLTQFALLGQVVNVAPDDLERFDRLNGDEPEPLPAKTTRKPSGK